MVSRNSHAGPDPVVERMVQLLPHPLCLVDADGHIVVANQPLADRLGDPINDLTGRHLRECLDDDPARIEEMLDRWRRSGGWRPGGLKVRGASTEEATFHCSGARLPGTDLVLIELAQHEGAVADFVALTREVEVANLRRMELRLQESLDELEEVNQRLEAANAELDRYASMVAHDIRTPFNAIARFTDLLVEDHGEDLPDGARQMLSAIARLAGRGEDVTEALLSLARTGQAELVPGGTDSNEVVERVRADLAAAIADADAELSVGNLPDCAAQPVHLERVLTNLVTNALKYGVDDRPTLIIVDGEQRDDWIHFTVSDNGRGIPAGEHDSVFEPMVRGASAADKPGTGVGLATCRKIVEAYGGVIEVADGEGEGTTIAFSLPAADPPTR